MMWEKRNEKRKKKRKKIKRTVATRKRSKRALIDENNKYRTLHNPYRQTRSCQEVKKNSETRKIVTIKAKHRYSHDAREPRVWVCCVRSSLNGSIQSWVMCVCTKLHVFMVYRWEKYRTENERKKEKYVHNCIMNRIFLFSFARVRSPTRINFWLWLFFFFFFLIVVFISFTFSNFCVEAAAVAAAAGTLFVFFIQSGTVWQQ